MDLEDKAGEKIEETETNKNTTNDLKHLYLDLDVRICKLEDMFDGKVKDMDDHNLFSSEANHDKLQNRVDSDNAHVERSEKYIVNRFDNELNLNDGSDKKMSKSLAHELFSILYSEGQVDEDSISMLLKNLCCCLVDGRIPLTYHQRGLLRPYKEMMKAINVSPENHIEDILDTYKHISASFAGTIIPIVDPILRAYI